MRKMSRKCIEHVCVSAFDEHLHMCHAIAIRASHFQSARAKKRRKKNVRFWLKIIMRQPLNRFELSATGHTCCLSSARIRWYRKTKIYSVHMARKRPNEGKRKPISEILGKFNAQARGARQQQQQNDCS